MTVESLLRELEPLTHAGRVRRMVEIGREAATHPATAALLDAMEAGAHYERMLALQSCYGSRDGAHVLRALADPSRGVRGLAAKLVPIACDDVQAEAALTAAHTRLRRVLIRGLRRHDRAVPIDRFLETQAAAGDPSFPVLLPFGSAGVVRRHLERGMSTAGIPEWRRLARLHPALAAEVLRGRALALTGSDPRLLWQVNAVLPIVADRHAADALALVEALLPHTSLAHLHLQWLGQRAPNEVADLVLRSPDRPTLSLTQVAHRLSADRLLQLLQRAPHVVTGAGWFRRLTPADRAALFTSCQRGWMDAEGRIAPKLVSELPRELREGEARRHVGLPALATRPAERFPYAALLPWDEARAALEPYVRDPDPELRGPALRALVSATAYHRDRLGEALAWVRARKNEQDPVRGAMLSALAALPPGMWRAEHLDDLGQVIRDALNAADLSYGTAAFAEQLVIALLPFHPEWAAQWLATLVKERGQVTFYGLGDRLSDRDVERIAPALLPVFEAWQVRERSHHLIAAAQSLGRRLRRFDGLVRLLERLIDDARQPWVAVSALSLLEEHRPERFRELVPALVREDGSWATQYVVYEHLHRRRQDLITPFLGRRAYRGRFGTGRTRFVLPLTTGFHRWTPTQQRTFETTLHELIADSKRETPTVLSAVRQLAAMPAVDVSRLGALSESAMQAVRDQAIRALGQLDAGDGVPALIAMMDDDRGRIAIYALRQATLEMPAFRAVSLLRGVPLEKVTIAKEVVRLLGELPSAEAHAELLALNARDLHRDVRIALLRALWDHLERDGTWEMMVYAAQSEDAAVATMVSRIPAERLSPPSQQQLVGVLATLLGHGEPRVRLAALERCHQLPVPDPEQRLLPPLLGALGSALPDERRGAARAALATYVGVNAQAIGRTVEALLPNRRAVWTILEELLRLARTQRGHLLPTSRAILAALSLDPVTLALRAEVAPHLLPWGDVRDLLVELAARDELGADVLCVSIHSIIDAAHRADAGDLTELEATFGASTDDRLRRLGLAALVGLSREPRGWDDARLARLREYQHDPSPLVAAAAQFTFPPEEP